MPEKCMALLKALDALRREEPFEGFCETVALEQNSQKRWRLSISFRRARTAAQSVTAADFADQDDLEGPALGAATRAAQIEQRRSHLSNSADLSQGGRSITTPTPSASTAPGLVMVIRRPDNRKLRQQCCQMLGERLEQLKARGIAGGNHALGNRRVIQRISKASALRHGQSRPSTRDQSPASGEYPAPSRNNRSPRRP
jgi:hypothetical protein